MALDWLAEEEGEQKPLDKERMNARPWKILVVDDEEEIHRVTHLALRRFNYEGRGVEVLGARSGLEACDVVRNHPDLAVIFLDVVMETDDAGLRVIDYIRNTLNNHTVRIIIRTGQAGRAPEIDIVTKYDINGYREKTELTSDKLLSQMYTALSSYRDLIELHTEMQRRLEAENKLIQQFSQLQEAYRRLDHFTKAASHDLQEPLRKIQLWTDKLVEAVHAIPGDTAYQSANKLVNFTQTVSEMIGELKEVSMIESSQSKLAEIDLNKLVNEVEVELQETHAQIDFETGSLPTIQGDMAGYRLLFTSVIEEIALSDPNQEDIKVEIGAEDAGDEKNVRVFIQDHGAGIAPEEMDKLFQPYSRVVINGVASSGIGLYVSKRIIEIHGGNIECSSEPDNGTRITITLPKKPLPESPADPV